VTRIRLALAAAMVGLLVAVPAQASVAKLAGTTGPGFTITLKKGTAKVTRLKAGTYTITVADKSAQHNFHLIGAGVNKKTTVGYVGKKTWTVTLQKGKTYRFICDPHVTFGMKGSFKTF
jgi:plastocyanin